MALATLEGSTELADMMYQLAVATVDTSKDEFLGIHSRYGQLGVADSQTRTAPRSSFLPKTKNADW